MRYVEYLMIILLSASMGIAVDQAGQSIMRTRRSGCSSSTMRRLDDYNVM